MPIIVGGSSAPVTPPTTVTSPDGKLTVTTDPTNGGLFLIANFSSLSPKPYLVRFERADGTRVRSGDPAQAPGGVARAYEGEADLATAWPIRAVPIFAYTSTAVTVGDGTTRTGKQPEDPLFYADYDLATGYASITVPEPTGLTDWWLKSLGQPSLSLLLSAKGQLTETATAQFDPITVPLVDTPSGSFLGVSRQPMEVVFAVETVTARQKLGLMQRAGTVLAQPRTGYTDWGDFYAIITSLSSTPLVAQSQARRDVTVTLQPVGRPSTVDAPLGVPGRSIAEGKTIAGTIAQAATTWPQIKDAAGFPS